MNGRIIKAGAQYLSTLPQSPIEVEESQTPIIGFRTWLISRDHCSIRSLLDFRDIPWQHMERYESHCNGILASEFKTLGSISHSLETVPEIKCTCGVYAFDSIEDLMKEKFQVGGIYQVYGQVSLWGKVIPHEKGYRAQYAYPYCFYELPTPENFSAINFKKLANQYGVDVLKPPKELLDYVENINQRYYERAKQVRQRMKWPTSKI